MLFEKQVTVIHMALFASHNSYCFNQKQLKNEQLKSDYMVLVIRLHNCAVL